MKDKEIYEDIPDDWTIIALLPKGKYIVKETEKG